MIENNFVEIEKKLKEIREFHIKKYDHTKLHANVGDIIWTCYDNKAIQVRITDIDSFKNESHDDGYIFYWIEHINVTKFEKFIQYLKFYSWIYIFSHLKIPQFKINHKLGPGYSVLFGRYESLFKTKHEAVIENYIQNILNDLDNIKDEIMDHMNDKKIN